MSPSKLRWARNVGAFDAEPRVAALARLFFTEFAKKGRSGLGLGLGLGLA